MCQLKKRICENESDLELELELEFELELELEQWLIFVKPID